MENSKWVKEKIQNVDGFNYWVFKCENCGALSDKIEDNCPQCKCKMDNVEELWEDLFEQFFGFGF